MSRLIAGTIPKQRPLNAVIAPMVSTRRTVEENALPTSAYLDLLGKPFLADARGPASYDCVGLALAVAARLGKALPAYLSNEAELHAQLGTNGATLADLPQIPRPVPGCIVLFRLGPEQHHVGVMIDEYRMVHAFQGTGVVIERVISPLWQRKVIGFYSL